MPLEFQVDLALYGNSCVIQTRVPRSLFGRLRVGDDVMIVDDSVEGRLCRVTLLTNGDREVRLSAVSPASPAGTPRPDGLDA